MSLGLLLPAALAALGALLLPLLIHLARRSQMAPTQFAALRWLRRAARPQRRVRLEEWPLLLLRLLLLVLLALWLARPVLYGPQPADGWTVVVPGVDVDQARALAEGAEPPRWLAPGFPPLDGPAPSGAVPVSSLLRQLDAELPRGVSITVAVPEWLQGMDAQRPRLSRPVGWYVLPGAMQAPEASSADPFVLQVRHDGDRAPAVRYLRAAAASWSDAEGPVGDALQAGPASAAPDSAATHLAWLASGPVPEEMLDWTRNGGVLLLDAASEVELPAGSVAWWRSDAGEALVEGAAYGQGRLLRFTRALTPAHMPQLLEADFALQLREVLQEPPPEPAAAAATAHAPVQVGIAWPRAPRELRPWMAVLIALLFVFERWLATSPKRQVPSVGEQP